MVMMAWPADAAWNRNNCVGPAGMAGPTRDTPRKRTAGDDTVGLAYCPGPMVCKVISTSSPTGTLMVCPLSATVRLIFVPVAAPGELAGETVPPAPQAAKAATNARPTTNLAKENMLELRSPTHRCPARSLPFHYRRTPRKQSFIARDDFGNKPFGHGSLRANEHELGRNRMGIIFGGLIHARAFVESLARYH